MNDYLWGLLTLPIGVAAVFITIIIIKGGYLLLGLVGKVGIARIGRPDNEYRYRAGAVVATSRRSLLINKGTTGVVFFTGLAHPHLGYGTVTRIESRIRSSDRDLAAIDCD